jgi:DNA-binding GntR family transcriptional regulator
MAQTMDEVEKALDAIINGDMEKAREAYINT